MANKAGIAHFVEERDFDNEQKTLNKKVTSNKTKHAEAEKKLADLMNKVAQISEIGYNFLLGIMYFTGDIGYQNFLSFVHVHSLLTLDNNKHLSTGY